MVVHFSTAQLLFLVTVSGLSMAVVLSLRLICGSSVILFSKSLQADQMVIHPVTTKGMQFLYYPPESLKKVVVKIYFEFCFATLYWEFFAITVTLLVHIHLFEYVDIYVPKCHIVILLSVSRTDLFSYARRWYLRF